MTSLNISRRKVGGLHFLKVGRFTFMACLSKPKPEPRPQFRTSSDGVLVLGYTDEEAIAIMPRENRQLKTILALGAGVVAIGLFAVLMQMRSVTIPALAEDECEYFHGALALTDVVRDGDHVNCIYR